LDLSLAGFLRVTARSAKCILAIIKFCASVCVSVGHDPVLIQAQVR